MRSVIHRYKENEMPVNVTWERKGGILIGSLEGRIDGSNASDFQSALESGIGTGDNALILDFEKVPFISSAGLRVGLVIARKFNEPGKKFGVCTLPDPVREVVVISGFDQLISVYGSQGEAIRALEGE